MSVPPDALIEWRCKCGRIVGYARSVTGRGFWAYRTITTDDRTPRVRAEKPIPPILPASGLHTTCGRHIVTIRSADLRASPTRKRVVILEPEGRWNTRRTAPPTAPPAPEAPRPTTSREW